MLAKLGVGVLALGAVVTVPAGLALQQYGWATVEVEQKGDEGLHLFIPVPLVLVSLALGFVPREELADASRELAEVGPLVDAVLNELADCPDGVLVEVRGGPETVRVAKTGGRLTVYVDTPEEKVRVKVPIWGANRIVQQLSHMGSIEGG